MKEDKIMAKIAKLIENDEQFETVEDFVEYYHSLIAPQLRQDYGKTKTEQAYRFFLSYVKGFTVVAEEEVRNGCFIESIDSTVPLPMGVPCGVFPIEDMAIIVPVASNMADAYEMDCIIDWIETGRVKVLQKKKKAVVSVADQSKGTYQEPTKKTTGYKPEKVKEATQYLFQQFKARGITSQEEVIEEIDALYERGFGDKSLVSTEEKIIKAAKYYKKYEVTFKEKKKKDKMQICSGDVLQPGKTLPFLPKSRAGMIFTTPELQDVYILNFTPRDLPEHVLARFAITSAVGMALVFAGPGAGVVSAATTAAGAATAAAEATAAATAATAATAAAASADALVATSTAHAASSALSAAIAKFVAYDTVRVGVQVGASVGLKAASDADRRLPKNVTKCSKEELRNALSKNKMKWYKDDMAMRIIGD